MYNISTEKRVEYSEIYFNRDSHKNRISLGTGSFADVYIGNYRTQQVVVKELKREAIKKVDEFLDETGILSRMNHSNIIDLYGICTDRAKNSKNLLEREPFYCLVMEYASKGSLHSLIHENNEPLNETRIVAILKQIASGLIYLHSSSPPIIHGDLKPTNIVFDNENNVKLMDFGFSSIKQETRENNNETTSKGLRWMAPELLIEKPTLKSDIYSFGVIIWQLFTHKLPYPDAKNEVQVFNSMKNSNTLKFKFPPNISLMLKQLGERCLNYKPELRPTAKYILDDLNKNFPNVNCDIPEKPITNFSSNRVSIPSPLPDLSIIKPNNSQTEMNFAAVKNKFELMAAKNRGNITPIISCHRRSLSRKGK